MHIPSLPLNIIPNAAIQTVSSLVNRASSGVKGFESDLDSGNLTGAQSFLSTLEQKLSLGGANGASSAFSSQIAQVSNDLQSGDLIAAHADFATLKMALAQRQNETSNSGNSAQNQTASAQGSLAALALSSTLQQNAFAGAVNLSAPGNVPSFSISM